MIEIDWTHPFPAAYGIVTVPAGMVVYRGYSTLYPPVSDRPAYYGSLEIASAYSKPNDYMLSAFTNTRPLKMLDLRCMKDILRDLFDSNPEKKSSLAVILSFGICSLYHQIRLMQNRYRNVTAGYTALKASYKESEYFEQPGVRVAETTNDAETMGFLRSLFDGFVDGFFSPLSPSAYHVEKGGIMNPEMIVFNPLASGMQKLSVIPHKLPKVTIDYIYAIELKRLQFRKEYDHTLYMKGGYKDTSVPTVEDIYVRWDKDPEIRTLFEKGEEEGKEWAAIANLMLVPNPVPTLPVNPWNLSVEPDIPVRSYTRLQRKTRRKRL